MENPIEGMSTKDRNQNDMRKLYEILSLYANRKKRLAFTLPEFAHNNKDLLIIVADPKTDLLFVSYHDKTATGRIKDAKSLRPHIVKDMMRMTDFDDTVMGFLVSIAEILKLKSIKYGNEILKQVENAIWNIAKVLKNIKKPVESVGSKITLPTYEQEITK